MLIVKSPFNTFPPSLRASPPPYMFENQVLVKIACFVCSPFTQQAITATSAPGEMIALWTKFGGKIALRVASENAIKRE